MIDILLLLQMLSFEACESLVIQDKQCFEHVYECALDGEDPIWCLEDYLIERD
jgi:hypothetical protein